MTPELTLLHRTGCHLCEDMEQLLDELLPTGSFRLVRRDIDATPELRERWHTEVPVLLLGDRELCRHFLDLEAVRSALAGYNSESSLTSN